MLPTRTLSRFILAEERKYPGSTGVLSDLLVSIALGVKIISHLVASAGIATLARSTGKKNIHGDSTVGLDEEADQVLVELLGSCGHFGLLVSEERDAVVATEDKGGKYVVAFDPLDGSSNIGSNIPTGTIFAIFRRGAAGNSDPSGDFLQPGTSLAAAGYAVYGAKTTFVYSAGNGVHGFTLEPDIGEFVLTDELIKIPEKGAIFSVNEGNTPWWTPGVQTFLDELKAGNKGMEKPYSGRYVGSLVADFDRTLHRGGIFLYPIDSRRPKGRLRLLYETMPLAFIMEQAGGKAFSGMTRILDIVPKDIHERSAFEAGSPFEMGWYHEVMRRVGAA